MPAFAFSTSSLLSATQLSLLMPANAEAVFARHRNRDIQQLEYLRHVKALADRLPNQPYLVNLCECSYSFLVAFGAALVRGQTNLLPPSRAERVISEMLHDWQGSYVVDDAYVAPTLSVPDDHVAGFDVPWIKAGHIAVIGFTSGSTGIPQAYPKTWRGFAASAHNNRKAISAVLGNAAHFNIVATVPPQHMYGIEMSVLMPLLGGATLCTRRELFPADIAAALAELAEPRILVSTPIHLRALVNSGQPLPKLAVIISATAPLSQALATEIEITLQAQVLELFGSTETCVIASRRTAHEASWHLLEGIHLSAQPDCTQINAAWFTQATNLQDIVECLPDGRFLLQGRHADLIEIAGKRASLADLTRRLQALEGVLDAAIVQEANNGGVQRVAALVVAPTREIAELLQEFRAYVDPVFLPRKIVKVAALPYNALGKLPRQALLDLLQSSSQ